MRRSMFLGVLLVLGGCGSPAALPELAVFDGTCVSEGVQINGAEVTPYDLTSAGVVEIRAANLVRGPCAMPIIGFDGVAFDLTASSCEEDGRHMYLDGGMGTLDGDTLRFEVDGATEELSTGIRYEYHSTCTAVQR